MFLMVIVYYYDDTSTATTPLRLLFSWDLLLPLLL